MTLLRTPSAAPSASTDDLSDLAVTGLAEDAGLAQAAPLRTDAPVLRAGSDSQALAAPAVVGLASASTDGTPTAGVEMASWLAPIIIGGGLLAGALLVSFKERRRRQLAG